METSVQSWGFQLVPRRPASPSLRRVHILRTSPPKGDATPAISSTLATKKWAVPFSAAQIAYLLRTLHRLAVFCEVGIKLFAVLYVLNFISHFAARFYFLY